MTRTFLLALAFAISGCAAHDKAAVAQTSREGDAAAKRGSEHPVYVGHGSDGELVMASTHHDAMNGVAVASTELGITGKDDPDLICKRETVTGTHMPQWICRYRKEVEEDRMRTQQMLEKIPKACMDRVCNQ